VHLFAGGLGINASFMRLTEQKPVLPTMAKQDLKKYCVHPHVSTVDNICVTVLLCVALGCERLMDCLLSTL
jgi:hypothetical protein